MVPPEHGLQLRSEVMNICICVNTNVHAFDVHGLGSRFPAVATQALLNGGSRSSMQVRTDGKQSGRRQGFSAAPKLLQKAGLRQQSPTGRQAKL
ncbi:hypothetical protein [Aminobacter aminovorans]|uniref:hypothetical protein n=1 Tax=Aminobacter aminovorans TaxID=83263 RepID=UPI00285B4DBF|nr:hypothetical protein [Aminobacter aminovorans]MDR7225379.1 hypothetical protein [Aminobacter aminovorans]